MTRTNMAIVSIAVMGCICMLWAAPGANDALPDVMISSKDNYWQPGTATMAASGTADIVVNEDSKAQAWEGFGGTFNEMGWDALSAVSSEIPRAMKLLFDENEGANFVYGRVPLGASDYAMSWYTLAETANDYSMTNFSIARDREKLIPYIKAALAVKPDIHLWASPWVCPGWMKSGQNFKDDPNTLSAYALYFARFIEEYKKEDLVIEAVHHQNEPGYAQVKWTNALFVKFLRDYLGPKFAERNITAEIWCGTMSHPMDSTIAIDCMNDANAMKYIKGFGLQWNLESVVPTLSKKGRVWQTEHRCGNYNFTAKYWDQSRYNSNRPQNDHLYGEESWQLIRDWVAAGVNSYCAWNMVLDSQGKSLGNWPQNALLVVNRSTRELTITPAYWVFRHFSQYIDSGATRLNTSGSNDVLAFLNPDGDIITQIYNKNDAAKKMTVQVSGSYYQFDIPAHAWATLRTRNAVAAKDHNTTRQSGAANGFRAVREGNGIRIVPPAHYSGGITEIIGINGRVLERFSLPHGSHDAGYLVHPSSTGMLVVRMINGNDVSVARIVPAP